MEIHKESPVTGEPEWGVPRIPGISIDSTCPCWFFVMSSVTETLLSSLGIIMNTCNSGFSLPQGSIQQLTIYSDPRTPEELCEAQESSVSLWIRPPSLPSHPGLCTSIPKSARARLGAHPILLPQRHAVSRPLIMASTAPSPILGFWHSFTF